MAKEMLRLEKCINDIETLTGFKVFDIDIAKDEIDSNESFFLYYDKGPIRKDDNMNLLRDFFLMFVTKDNSNIDEYELIDKSPSWGLRFRSTEYEYGKIGDSQEVVRTTTFYFHQAVKKCQ